jgi:hypothetical protein
MKSHKSYWCFTCRANVTLTHTKDYQEHEVDIIPQTYYEEIEKEAEYTDDMILFQNKFSHVR